MIIKKARSEFKGTFYNDHYGTNNYTVLSDYTKLNALEKGLSIIAIKSTKNLDNIINCLKSYKNNLSEQIQLQPDMIKILLRKVIQVQHCIIV